MGQQFVRLIATMSLVVVSHSNIQLTKGYEDYALTNVLVTQTKIVLALHYRKAKNSRYIFSKYWYYVISEITEMRRRPQSFQFWDFFVITPSVDKFDHVLSCLCERYEEHDKIDHTAGPNVWLDITIDIRKWDSVVPFSSLESVQHIMRSNPVPQIKYQLPWHHHRFYANIWYHSWQKCVLALLLPNTYMISKDKLLLYLCLSEEVFRTTTVQKGNMKSWLELSALEFAFHSHSFEWVLLGL